MTIALPAIALGLRQSALMTRMMRSSMLDVMGEPYITTARAQGLPERRVVTRYALARRRGAFRHRRRPVGELSAERRGRDRTDLLAAGPRQVADRRGRRGATIPIVEGAVLAIAVMLAMLNLAIDLIYALLDPRVRLS